MSLLRKPLLPKVGRAEWRQFVSQIAVAVGAPGSKRNGTRRPLPFNGEIRIDFLGSIVRKSVHDYVSMYAAQQHCRTMC